MSSESILAEAGFKISQKLKGMAGQEVFLCTKARGTKPYRIVVIHNGEIAGEFPSLKSCSLKIYNPETLHQGKYLIYENQESEAWELKVPALNLDTLKVEKNFYQPDMQESWVNGIDVDPTGRYTVFAIQFDDFPELEIHDNESGEMMKLDCEDLIDAPMENVRWNEAPNSVIFYNSVTDEDQICPIDMNERKVLWV